MKKPNVIFILSDDQGNWAMGNENKDLHTPNLDRLAQTGVKFSHFFCASPVCSPARMSIITGKIPSAHGVHDWIAEGHIDESEIAEELLNELKKDNPDEEYKWPKDQLTNSKAIRFLDGHQTITQELAKNGYNCAISGKWHMGDAGKPQCGFTHWRTIALGGDNYFYSTVLKDGHFDMIKGKYLTEYITENALDYINNYNDENPFFLAVHYTAPHAPWGAEHHPKEYIDMYDNTDFPNLPNEQPHEWANNQYASEEERLRVRKEFLRGYCAATTAMDKGIGDILDLLEDKDMRENTIVIFTADNGMSMGHHGIFGKGNGTSPLNMYDSAVEVPFIISQPKCIKENVVVDEMFSHYDIFQTLTDELSIEVQFESKLPGTSFAPVLHGEKVAGRENVVILDEYGPVRMIRSKEWKYVQRYGKFEGVNELYDLVNDPCEKVNLFDDKKYYDKIEEMKMSMKKWYEEYADPKFDGVNHEVTGRGQVSAVTSTEEKKFR